MDRPSWTVYISSELITISAQMKSLKTPMKVKMASVARAGFASGMITRHRTPKRLHPSMKAASSSSRGIERKYCLSRNVPKALARPGTISAA